MARFTLPRDLYHGPHALEALKTLPGKRAMICVGGGSMKRFGFLDRAEAYLKEAGMEVELFEGIEPDPSVETVMKGAAAMEKFQPDWIVAIGGGHGLSAMLRGLKRYTKYITAIVTVADDGGGSGMLREDLGMLPPGDIRNCIMSLANTEPTMQKLLNYRFTEGSLAGQSFGNLFLAALNGIMPSFDRAVESLSQVLAITGRVLPVTNENIQLEAEFENGARVVGESRIFQCKQEQDCRIRRVNLLPSRPKALPEAVEAIREAEMVVLAPGSLYTSIIPNLLVDGIVEAIRESRALKIYVCNVMTQEGETEGYTASDHIRALFNHSCPGLFDLCLVNDAPIPPSVMRGYTREGAEPILCDRDACEALGVEVITRPVSTVENGLVRHNPGHLAWELVRLHAQRNIRPVAREKGDFARHDPDKLAEAVLDVYRQRAMRIFRGKNRYIIEE